MIAAIGQVGFFIGFALAIIVVILIHEAAHYGAARAFGIKVEEYFVGFGPRLWSFRRGETEYGIKAIPLGGYVKIAGMNPFAEPTPEEWPRTFNAKPIWQRAIVIFSGPGTHFVIAAILFSSWLALGTAHYAPTIAAVQKELNGGASPAQAAGLRPGDEIESVDGKTMDRQQFIDYTRSHVGEPVALIVRRGDERPTITVTPVLASVPGVGKVGRLGVELGAGRTLWVERPGIGSAIAGGVRMTGTFTAAVVTNLGRVFNLPRIGRLLFSPAQRSDQDPVSVVGVGRIAGQTAETNPIDVIFLFAFFNIALGVFNLIPLLPLDGGHLLVLLVEKIRGKAIDARKLVPVSAAFAAFFIAFGIALIYLDFAKPLTLPR